MNSPDDLIQKCLNEGHIKFFDYTHFNNIELIGEGGHGKVYRATLKDKDITVALKSFKSNNVTIKEIVNEVIVDMHSNIIRLYGATKSKDCWQHDPNSRPDIQQVFLDLKNLITNVKQAINPIVQDSSTLEAHGSTQLFDQSNLNMFISDSTQRVLLQNTLSLNNDGMCDDEKSLSELNNLLEINPNNTEALISQALADLNRSLELEPTDASALGERSVKIVTAGLVFVLKGFGMDRAHVTKLHE
ncbi:2959_t:CDS:2 [Cetraspora pellucida]|uniref:2959_t:CDS:1 n=1 Tax=Cetraspora pellucida TaxID=1433469 RepID=A0A9N8Z0P2_9GLOM|nr:2959_t:CDS:2 [Cetraspora pellucida]